jgi:hypothetical protein
MNPYKSISKMNLLELAVELNPKPTAREALIAGRLRELHEEYEKLIEAYCGTIKSMGDSMVKYKDSARWIPVSERMPEENTIIDGWNEHIGCRWSDLLYKDGEFRQPANRQGVTHHQGTTPSHYQGVGVAIVMPTHWKRITLPEETP